MVYWGPNSIGSVYGPSALYTLNLNLLRLHVAAVSRRNAATLKLLKTLRTH